MIDNKKFIMIFPNGAELTRCSFADFLQDERVLVIDGGEYIPRNFVLRFLHRVHFSFKVNRVINLPFKHIWKRPLDDIQWDDSKQYYILSTRFAPTDIYYLKKKREEHNIKYILFAYDAWDDLQWSKVNHYYHEKLHFDMIITFDNADAEQKHFIYSDHHYSMLSDNSPSEIAYDLYFIGVNKGRYKKLIEIYDVLKSGGVSMYYRLSDVALAQRQYQNQIIYSSLEDRIPYPEVVEGIKKANCILEVLIDLQTGATLRYYEAICYNKKLLTNNKNVVNLPFYNPNYIHVFEKPENIDLEWVKERIPVDYHYDGRFSPTHLIDQIIGLEEEKKRQ